MDQKLIYTDICNSKIEEKVKKELGIDILLMYSIKDWGINEAIRLLTIPEIDLVVINTINEMTLMEIAISALLCKPILVTAKDAKEYDLIEKTVDYIDYQCDMRTIDSTIVQWYKIYRS
jgi:hypothetical protein